MISKIFKIKSSFQKYLLLCFLCNFSNLIFSQKCDCYTNKNVPLLYYINKYKIGNETFYANNFNTKVSFTEDSPNLNFEEKIELKDLLKNITGYYHTESMSVFNEALDFPLIKTTEEIFYLNFETKKIIEHEKVYSEFILKNRITTETAYGESFVPKYFKSKVLKVSNKFEEDEIEYNFNFILHNVFNFDKWINSYKKIKVVDVDQLRYGDYILYKSKQENIEFKNQNVLVTVIKLIEKAKFNLDEGKVLIDEFEEKEYEANIEFYLDFNHKLVRIKFSNSRETLVLDLFDEENCKSKVFKDFKLDQYYKKNKTLDSK